MGKKMKFPFLFKPTETTTAATATATSSWPWPTCVNNPKTLSFRATTTTDGNNIFKTINSAYLTDAAETPASSFTLRREEESLSEIIDESAVVGGLRSDRLFFEPGETSSILEVAKTYSNSSDFAYKESAAIMEMDSRDPFLDFRSSMAEMVEAHGLKDWESLEELLTCFLRVNGKANHGYIVGAFVDLLIHLSLSSSNEASSCSTSAVDERCSSSSTAATTTQCLSFTSPLSFSSSSNYSSTTSPCLSLLMENEDDDQIVVDEKNVQSCSDSC